MSLDGERRTNGQRPEPIAVVGIGCRLPGNISTPDELFEAFRDGRDLVTTVPPDRWDVDAYYDPDPITPGKTYQRSGGFVAHVDQFDAGFFGISDNDADRMDPQQRMVLEAAWHALENAGQAPEELAGSATGVFLAMSNANDYAHLKQPLAKPEETTGHDLMANNTAITAGRVAHFLDLRGPCITIDTACSGSLVALHLARQSLLTGECDAALVLAVNVVVLPLVDILYSKLKLASPSGRCRAFDAAADGIVRGEGSVGILVRRQSDAARRGDHILASVVVTAVNQDGRTGALTAPNGASQASLMRTALSAAEVRPTDIGYVEAHGTGTPVGDPVEMHALADVYGRDRGPDQPLLIGSAKTNFGHLESASGLLGLVKVALSLDRQTIFPSLHFQRLNPGIELNGSQIEVPTSPVAWPRSDQSRLAAINAFGFSGTNAHAIVQEAPREERGAESRGDDSSELVVLSAKSAAALAELADCWTAFLDESTSTPLADIAFTAATGRARMRHRLAVVGTGVTDVAGKVRSWRAGRSPSGVAAGQVRPNRAPDIAFVFTGQGAQHPGMGRKLYDAEPVFRAAIDRCAALMDPQLGVPLVDVLFGRAEVDLDDTQFAQPALFAVELGLAELLRHWGVEPTVLLGHSIGEIVAACISGILDVEAAAQLALTRGRLMARLPRDGKMLAVAASVQEARELIVGREADVALAAVNGPSSVVLSGRAEAIDGIAGVLRDVGVRSTELRVSHAFHSPLMDPMLTELADVASSIPTGQGTVPVISNVTGALLEEPVDGRYWVSHARQTVLFYEGLCEAQRRGCSVFVEVGPHPTLLAAFSLDLGPKATFVSTLRRDGDDLVHLLEAVGALHAAGAPIDFDRLFEGKGGRRVPVPVYPFRPDRHWLPVGPPNGNRSAPPSARNGDHPEPTVALHPLLGTVVGRDGTRTSFESTVVPGAPWADHRILGATVFPGTGYLEAAARGYAASRGEDWRAVALREVRFERPILLAYGTRHTLKLTVDAGAAEGDGAPGFTLSSDRDGVDEVLCRGRITEVGATGVERVDVDGDLARMRSKVSAGAFYGQLRAAGLEYGSNFATVRDLSVGADGSGEAIGRVAAAASEDMPGMHSYIMTTVLDGCLHVAGAALQSLDPAALSVAMVPVSLDAATLLREVPFSVWAHARVQKTADGQGMLADIRVIDDEGNLVALIEGLECRRKASFTSDDGRGSTQSTSESREELVAKLRARPEEERLGCVVAWLTAEVRDTMGRAAEDLDLDDFDPSTALLEIGLDSLLVTELQRRIQQRLEFRFKAQQNLDYQSLESLGRYLLSDVLMISPAAQPEPGDAAIPASVG